MVLRQLQRIFFSLKMACTLQGKKRGKIAYIMQIVHIELGNLCESCEKAFTLI